MSRINQDEYLETARLLFDPEKGRSLLHPLSLCRNRLPIVFPEEGAAFLSRMCVLIKEYRNQNSQRRYFVPRAERLCTDIMEALLPTFTGSRREHIERHLSDNEAMHGIVPPRPAANYHQTSEIAAAAD